MRQLFLDLWHAALLIPCPARSMIRHRNSQPVVGFPPPFTCAGTAPRLEKNPPFEGVGPPLEGG